MCQNAPFALLGAPVMLKVMTLLSALGHFSQTSLSFSLGTLWVEILVTTTLTPPLLSSLCIEILPQGELLYLATLFPLCSLLKVPQLRLPPWASLCLSAPSWSLQESSLWQSLFCNHFSLPPWTQI